MRFYCRKFAILNRVYVKRTNDINRVNRVRFDMDGGHYTVEKMLQGAPLKADEARPLLFFSL